MDPYPRYFGAEAPIADQNQSEPAGPQLPHLWEPPDYSNWTETYGISTTDGIQTQDNQITPTRVARLNSESVESLGGFVQGWSASPAAENVEMSDTKKRRRLEQNRASQRAFRERKTQEVAELQRAVMTLEGQKSALQSENETLKAALKDARKENETLKSILANACAMSARRVSADLAAIESPDPSLQSILVKFQLARSDSKDEEDDDGEENEDEDDEDEDDDFSTSC